MTWMMLVQLSIRSPYYGLTIKLILGSHDVDQEAEPKGAYRDLDGIS